LGRRSHRNRWLLGLTIGLVFGVASLIVGTIAWAIGLVALVLLAIDRDRIPLVGGACLGFGVAWLAIMLLADSRCQEGCSGPDITPWLAAGAAWTVVGVGLSLLSIRSRRATPT
jgi:4-hydroxybenzoate polyprenyltransferase